MLWSLVAVSLLGAPLVVRAKGHDVSSALRDMPARTAESAPEHDEPDSLLTKTSSRLGFDPVLQQVPLPNAAPGPLLSFGAIGPHTSTLNANPPDANAAIGLEHIVEVTNFRFAVFSKDGTLLYGPASTSTPWQGFDGKCAQHDSGDPVVLYDRLADRWVITHMAWDLGSGTGSQCVAVSTSSDPTGAWSRYEFPFASTNDAGKIGLWPDAYVYTTMLTTNDGQARVCAIDRIRMLSGMDATQQCFVVPVNESQPTPADLDGPRLPPAGAPAWLVSATFQDTLGVFRLHIDWKQPSASWLSARESVAIAHWDAPNCAECVSQPGTGQRLLAGAGHLQHRIVYRNFDDHEALVFSHAVDAGNGTLGVRWYEVRPDTTGKPVVFQQGTFAPDEKHRWMPSAAMDGAGNIAVGYSIASETVYPSIRYAARLAADPAGALTLGEASLYESAASQTWSDRWGDYSSMQIDPVDDCTFWFTAEYAEETGPATRVSSFRLPVCGVPNEFGLSVLPGSQVVTAGASVDYEVSTSKVSGSPEQIMLSVTDLPPGTSASVKPTSVPAGESAVLSVAASAQAAATDPMPFTVVATSTSRTHRAPARIQVRSDVTPDVPDSGLVDAGVSPNDGGVPDAGSSTDAQGNTAPNAAVSPSGCGCRSTSAPMDLLTAALATICIRRARSRLSKVKNHRSSSRPRLSSRPIGEPMDRQPDLTPIVIQKVSRSSCT